MLLFMMNLCSIAYSVFLYIILQILITNDLSLQFMSCSWCCSSWWIYAPSPTPSSFTSFSKSSPLMISPSSVSQCLTFSPVRVCLPVVIWYSLSFSSYHSYELSLQSSLFSMTLHVHDVVLHSDGMCFDIHLYAICYKFLFYIILIKYHLSLCLSILVMLSSRSSPTLFYFAISKYSLV